MIVEGQGICLWTRVRLPSTPLEHEVMNPHSIRKYEGFELAVYRHCLALMLNLGFQDEYDVEQ